MEEEEISQEEEIDLSAIRYKEKEPTKKEPTKKEKHEKKERDTGIPVEFEKKIKKMKPQKDKPTDDEIKKRRTLILILQMYVNEFSKLKKYKNTNFDKKSMDELNEMHKEFDATLSCRSTVNTGVTMAVKAIQTLEFVLCSYTPIQAQGLSNIVNDPDVIEDIKLIVLKNMPLVSSEPEQRLLFKMITTTMQLHSINTYNSEIRQVGSEKISEINGEYTDI